MPLLTTGFTVIISQLICKYLLMFYAMRISFNSNAFTPIIPARLKTEDILLMHDDARCWSSLGPPASSCAGPPSARGRARAGGGGASGSASLFPTPASSQNLPQTTECAGEAWAGLGWAGLGHRKRSKCSLRQQIKIALQTILA